jgi:hypothetical protein
MWFNYHSKQPRATQANYVPTRASVEVAPGHFESAAGDWKKQCFRPIHGLAAKNLEIFRASAQ